MGRAITKEEGIKGNASCSKRRVRTACLAAALAVVALLSLTVAAPRAWALTDSSGDFEYTIASDGTATIAKYKGSDASVKVPSTIGKLEVAKIGMNAFYGCKTISSVSLPASVKYVGESAFEDCSALRSVSFSEGLEKIGAFAFYRCGALTSVSLPDSLSVILGGAFQSCTSLAQVDFGTGLTTLEGATFKDCTVLRSVVLPDSLVTLGASTFSGCTALSSCTLGKNVSAVSTYAFYQCKSLKSIALPVSVKSIGDYAFEHCDALRSIGFSEGLSTIGFYSFDDCDSLTRVDLPNSVAHIGQGAFAGCAALSDVTFGNKLLSLDGATFDGCKSLRSVSLPDSLTTIAPSTFRGCTSLKSCTLGSNVTTIGTYAFYQCESLTSLKIPASCTSINDYAFDHCTSLRSLTIPASVVHIGNGAFFSLPAGSTLHVATNDQYTLLNGNSAYLHPTRTTVVLGSGSDESVFTDVPSKHWAKNYINQVNELGLMTGKGEGIFAPDEPLTRGMVVTILWRASGEPAASTSAGFIDVPANEWYAKAVDWAYEQGIIAGVGNGRFAPEVSVEREQLAKMIAGWARISGADMSASTSALHRCVDWRSVSPWAVDYLAWTSDRGILAGKQIDGIYYMDPQGHATRAEMAKVILTALNVVNA